MIFLKERIGKLLKDLEGQMYPVSFPAGTYRMKKTKGRLSDIENLDTSQWEIMGEAPLWGGHREYFWFETNITIPESCKEKCMVYEIWTGREGQWDAVNPQFSVFINGKLRQGFDVNHRSVILTESAEGGEHFRIVLSAFTGDRNFNLKLDSKLRVLDRKAEAYYYDLKVPYDTACLLDESSRRNMSEISRH